MSLKKEKIIRATLKVYVADGEKMSLDDVAEQAGCSKALVLQYFETKNNLLSATFDYVCLQIKEAISSVPFPEDDSRSSFREYIRAFWEAYFEYLILTWTV